MTEELPLLPHLPSEFLTWLWFRSDGNGGRFDLGGEIGQVDAWVDDRIAFRAAEDDKPRAVFTGENPAETLEARAALAGGRVVKELRLGLRRGDREFFVTLKGPLLDLHGAKLPAEVKEGGDEVLFERMFLLEELGFIVAGLLRLFAEDRTSPEWGSTLVPAMRAWVARPLDIGPDQA